MKRLSFAIVFLIAIIATALAQSNVQVIGPITTGNIPQFNSPTIIKDSGATGTVLSSMPANTMVCNPTAGTAAAQDCTPTSFWDAFCSSTIGQTWVRLSGGWGCTAVGYANPVWWGADPTGVADSTTALNSALAASNNIVFPPGTFKFNTTISYTIPSAASVTFRCSGQDVTTLKFAAGGVTFFHTDLKSTAHVRDCTFAATTVGGFTGLTLINLNTIAGVNYNVVMPSDIINNTFRGDDGPGGAHFWTTNLGITTVSDVNIQGNIFQGPSGTPQGNGVALSGNTVSAVTNSATSAGSAVLNFASVPAGVEVGMVVYDQTTPTGLPQSANGVLVLSKTSTTVTVSKNAIGGGVLNGDTIQFFNAGIIYNLYGNTFFQMAVGVNYGMGIQGVTLQNNNFTADTLGIASFANSFGLTELCVCGGNQFNATQNQIITNSPIADTIITGNLFYILDNTGTFPGINLVNSSRFNISGNDFADTHSGGTAPTAVSIGNTLTFNGYVGSNTFNGFLTAVSLGASSSLVTVGANSFAAAATNVSDSGTGNKVIGRILTNSASAQAIVSGTATTITSIVLGAGDWDVSCTISATTAATTTVTLFVTDISATNNTLDLTTGKAAESDFNGVVPGSGFTIAIPSPIVQVSPTTNTTFYCVGFISYGTSTLTANGFIRARQLN